MRDENDYGKAVKRYCNLLNNICINYLDVKYSNDILNSNLMRS